MEMATTSLDSRTPGPTCVWWGRGLPSAVAQPFWPSHSFCRISALTFCPSSLTQSLWAGDPRLCVLKGLPLYHPPIHLTSARRESGRKMIFGDHYSQSNSANRKLRKNIIAHLGQIVKWLDNIKFLYIHQLTQSKWILEVIPRGFPGSGDNKQFHLQWC